MDPADQICCWFGWWLVACGGSAGMVQSCRATSQSSCSTTTTTRRPAALWTRCWCSKQCWTLDWTTSASSVSSTRRRSMCFLLLGAAQSSHAHTIVLGWHVVMRKPEHCVRIRAPTVLPALKEPGAGGAPPRRASDAGREQRSSWSWVASGNTNILASPACAYGRHLNVLNTTGRGRGRARRGTALLQASLGCPPSASRSGCRCRSKAPS